MVTGSSGKPSETADAGGGGRLGGSAGGDGAGLVSLGSSPGLWDPRGPGPCLPWEEGQQAWSAGPPGSQRRWAWKGCWAGVRGETQLRKWTDVVPAA